jgi:hypothetical protein
MTLDERTGSTDEWRVAFLSAFQAESAWRRPSAGEPSSCDFLLISMK